MPRTSDLRQSDSIIRAILLLCTMGLASCTSGATPQLYQCSAFIEQHSCSELSGVVCARVDTGVRCIQAPCPSSTLRTYADACSACDNNKVDVVFTGSCELLQQRLASGKVEKQ
ncbi:MAG: hypothetical protein O7F73_05400 [Gammaproteobacteria bacterium]|nr:hypothetical protein [Gammaproteobacteria bacterium]